MEVALMYLSCYSSSYVSLLKMGSGSGTLLQTGTPIAVQRAQSKPEQFMHRHMAYRLNFSGTVKPIRSTREDWRMANDFTPLQMFPMVLHLAR